MIPQKVKDIARYIVDRCKEPSTWAGVSPVLLLVHVHLSTDQFAGLAAAGVGLASILAIAMKE